MNDLHDFIVSYPSYDDENFSEIMGRKLEFRELEGMESNKPNTREPFFYNYQILVSRWWSPWTNNRIGLLRWDPGSGKTRGSLAFSLMWSKNSSHKKTLILANSDIIYKAFDDEIIDYNKYDPELKGIIFKQGTKRHGKTISQSKYVMKQGFQRTSIIKLMSSLKKKLDDRNRRGLKPIELRDLIRELYSDYVIIVDEAHVVRKSESKKYKITYEGTVEFLDAVRDICPILLMTATPVVNTWEDIFSTLGLLHDPVTRRQMENEVKEINVEKDPSRFSEITDLVIKYSKGLVSDRKAESLVPDKIPLPSPYSRDGKSTKFTIYYADNTQVELSDINLLPFFMSEYQSAYTSKLEYKDISDLSEEEDVFFSALGKKKSIFYGPLRLAYDFAFPINENGEEIKSDVLVIYDSTTKKYQPSTQATILYRDDNGERVEEVFKIKWEDADQNEDRYAMWSSVFPNEKQVKFPSLDSGLGKYSIKYANLIWLLKYHPDLQEKAGFIHTLWVETGTKLLAASLNSNGWEQYTGDAILSESAKDKSGNIKYRFAILDGTVKRDSINKIIATFNSDANRKGEILRVIIGSRKSGISINLINGRFFFELSSDFNKSVRIQSEGRVFRAKSLLWAESQGLPRNIVTADIVALPSIPYYSPNDEYEEEEEVNRYIDAYNQYHDDIDSGIIRQKNYITPVILGPNDTEISWNVNPATLEVRLYGYAEKKDEYGRKIMTALKTASIENIIKMSIDDNQPIDSRTYSLLYGKDKRENIKGNIAYNIPKYWELELDPKNMDIMRSVAELVSDHKCVNNRYGMPKPLQSYSNVITTSLDLQLTSSLLSGGSSMGDLSLIYQKNLFLNDSKVIYSKDSYSRFINVLKNSPSDRIDFYFHFSASNAIDCKIIGLEFSLVLPTDMPLEDKKLLELKKNMILSLYQDYWTVYEDDKIVHCIWYVANTGSQSSKFGISSDSKLKTRFIYYQTEKDKNVADNIWKYFPTKAIERVYHSYFIEKIQKKENIIKDNCIRKGLKNFVHFSLGDSRLRLRSVFDTDLRKQTQDQISLQIPNEDIEKILGISWPQIQKKYGNNDRKFLIDVFSICEKENIMIIR